MSKTPLYILTSERTYSAAETFTDVLQKRNRATIVGETTRGGAHSTGGPRILNDYYIIKMPNGKNINPITKTNWEGIGIEPDIKISSEQALDTTLKIILTKQIAQNPAESELNHLGYSLLRENKAELAIFIFRENVKKYPKSANCYDSLGEAYMLQGNIELAIKNYRKSLEINPNNQNAVRMIEKMNKK